MLFCGNPLMPSVIARRETPVARDTANTPPYPITSLSAAATSRRILSSRKGDKERNRRWMSLCVTSPSIKQNRLNLFYLFPDRPLAGFCQMFVRSRLDNLLTKGRAVQGD